MIAKQDLGPIDIYLRETDQSEETFVNALRNGEPHATSIYAAEQVTRAIAALTEAIQVASDDQSRQFTNLISAIERR